MPQLINRKKIYFYIFIFLFLTTITNYNFLNNIKENFLIKEIDIKSSSEFIKDKISLELNYLDNQNIFLLEKKIIFNKLSNISYIENINIIINYPSKLIVKATKTNLVAITYIGQKKYYIGQNGKFINSETIVANETLPIIFGKFKITEYLDLIRILDQYFIDNQNINKFFFHKNKRWDIYFKNNIILKLPNNNIGKALNIYKKYVNSNKISFNTVIDLRIPGRLILKNG